MDLLQGRLQVSYQLFFFGFFPFAFSDIAADTEDQLASPVHRSTGADLDIVETPVFSSVLGDEVVTVNIYRGRLLQQLCFSPLSIPVPDMQLQDLLEGVAEHLGIFSIGLKNLAIYVYHDDTVPALIDQQLPTDHLIHQQVFVSLALRNIFKVSDGTNAIAGPVLKSLHV